MAYSRYKEIPDKKSVTGTRVKRSTLYPPIDRTDSDIYVLTQSGDTTYGLAQKYYGDVNYYWIIGEANEALKKAPQNIPPGTQLRIPSQVSKIIKDYDDLNNPLI